MTKKIVLNLDYEPPFRAIGICCPQKEYRLSWLINKQLGINLKRVADFEYFPQHHQEKKQFPVYRYRDIPLHLDLLLVSNRSGGLLLFPEPKTLDFLLLVRNPSQQLDLLPVLQKIRKISYVQAAFFVDDKLGKKEGDFFFDFELYLSPKKD